MCVCLYKLLYIRAHFTNDSENVHRVYSNTHTHNYNLRHLIEDFNHNRRRLHSAQIYELVSFACNSIWGRECDRDCDAPASVTLTGSRIHNTSTPVAPAHQMHCSITALIRSILLHGRPHRNYNSLQPHCELCAREPCKREARGKHLNSKGVRICTHTILST